MSERLNLDLLDEKRGMITDGILPGAPDFTAPHHGHLSIKQIKVQTYCDNPSSYSVWTYDTRGPSCMKKEAVPLRCTDGHT